MDEAELDVDRMLRTSPAIASKFVRSKVAEGDLVYALRGKIGEVRQVRSDLAGANLTQGTARLSPSDRIARGYFIWAMRNPRSVRQAELEAKGTTFREITLADLRHIQILVPPLAEQRGIAEALSDVDALLDAIERLIAKKRDLKQATMQQLLTGQTRLPGFNRKWELKRLGDLFEITSSKRVFQSEWRSEGIPFYRARELAVLAETGRVDNELFIDRLMYETFKSAHGVPQVGDMLVTGVGTLGKAYVVREEREFYFKDGNIIWFKIGGKVSAEFLRQLYLTKLIMKQITDGSAGTTVGTYTISVAKKTEIFRGQED